MAPTLYNSKMWADINVVGNTSASQRGAKILLEYKALALATGEWTVFGSWTGLAHASSDLILATTDFAATGAGYILEHTSGLQLCFQLDVTANTGLRAKIAHPSGKFAAPSSNTIAPTGTSEHILVGGGTDASPTFTTAFFTTAHTSHFVHAPAIDGWPYLAWSTKDTTNNQYRFFSVQPVVSRLPADTDGFAVIQSGTNITLLGVAYFWGSGSRVWQSTGDTATGFSLASVNEMSSGQVSSGPIPQRNSRVVWAVSTASQLKGWLPYQITTASNTALNRYDTMHVDAEREESYLGMPAGVTAQAVIFPYGELPSYSAGTLDIYVDGAETYAPAPVVPDDETPPTATLVSPVSLVGIARDTPIVLELDDDTDLAYYVIFAVYPGSGIVPQLVVDGGDLDLETGYTVETEVVGGKLQVSVLPSSGEWPAPGFLRARPIDGAGNYA